MTRAHLPLLTLATGILSIAVGGCSGSDSNPAGGGGTTGVAESSGGAGTGGSLATGGTAQVPTGGTTSNAVATGGAATGGVNAAGGAPATGGTIAGTGGKNTGGSATKAAGGAPGTGGKTASGGTNTGGATVTSASGGVSATGGSKAGGGVSATGGSVSVGGGTCVASVNTGKNASGTGPHKVTIETNSGTGISTGTIYRPTDLGGTEKYPIFVWGEGGCSQDGLSNQTAMAEIASHGYFIIADGTPGSTAANGSGAAAPLLAYITWAIAENSKPCSAYYQSMDTTKIASDGFSCGGLMSENASGDSRLTAVGITSSGLFSADQNLYKKIHTPLKILLGGSGDMAYTNGERDYTNISALGIPIVLFSKDGAGHGGDLFTARGGDFTAINLAWLNWQLKGDETSTGKAFLVGSSCKFCSATGWEFKSANLP